MMHNHISNQPLVSVIIPTCNRGHLIYDAVKSLEKQSYKNLEVIIVDDCSKLPVDLANFNFSLKIKCIYNKQNLGGAKSRNLGVDTADGDYICFLDDDDSYVNTKIESLIDEFRVDATLDVVFGRIIKKSEPQRIIKSKYINKSGILHSLKSIGYLHTNSSLIKKTVFNRIRFDEDLEKYQDTQLHIELITHFKCKYLNRPVAYWNDLHSSPQITDMNTEEQVMKSIKNYRMLINKLTQRQSIGFYYKNYMLLKLMYMRGAFGNRFISSNKVKPSYFEKLLASIFDWIKNKK